MKLLVVGHHIVVKEYQELWVSAARQFPDLNIEILCPKVWKEKTLVRAEALNEEFVPVHALSAPFARFRRQHFLFFIGLQKAIKKIQPDYVCCWGACNSLYSAQVVRVCKGLGIPCIFWGSRNTIRDYRTMYGRLNLRRYLFQMCREFNFANAMGAQAITEDAANVMRSEGFRGRILVRPMHGIGKCFLDVGRERIACQRGPSCPVRIGYVGIYKMNKGIDILIRAFSQMKHRSRAKLILRGQGPEEGALRELVSKQQIQEYVEWNPYVSYSEMPGVFRDLDVLVLPSVDRRGVLEKFGRVIIEAMACGAVAIGSRLGGIPDALGDGGIAVEPEDVDELANVLDRLCIDQEHWEHWQTKGFEMVSRTYSFDVLGRNLIEGLRDELGFFWGSRAQRAA